MSDNLCGYFISNLVFVTSSDKLGVYLMAYLGNSFLICYLSLQLTNQGERVYLTTYLYTSSQICYWSLHLTSLGGYI